MSKPIIKANLKGSDRVELVYNDRTVEMTITDFFNSLPASTLVISNTPSPATSGIYSGSGYLPGNITVNGLAGYTIYFTAIDEFKIFANKFLLENGECTFTSGNYEGTINIDTLTDNRTYTLPDVTGEIQVGPAVKRYKALLSQNAPIATTQTPSIIAGQIWEDTIGTADAGDLVVLGSYELISGTLGDVNAKYRSAAHDVPIFMTASLEYDGSPYIVSTDVNGDFNAFINTIGNIVWSYSSDGTFLATLTGAFLDKKVSPTLNNFPTNGSARILRISNNQVRVITYDSLYVETNDILLRSTVEIEVYP